MDITSLIIGDGTYSLRISDSTGGADYSSKEGANPPQLVITLVGTPTPTFTPTETQTPTPVTPTTTEVSVTPSFTPTPTGTSVPAGPITINYVYDPLNRLTNATYSNGRSFGYGYDAVGNVLQYTQVQSGSTITTGYDYDDANQLTTAQMDNSPIVWQYVYDPVGRLTEMLPDGNPANGAKRYSYNTAGYLIKAEAHDGNGYQLQAEMLYDGLGQRLSMTGYALGASVTTQYVLDPMQNGRPLKPAKEQRSLPEIQMECELYLTNWPLGLLTDVSNE